MQSELNSGSRSPRLIDPPEDDQERAKNVLRYFEVKTEQAKQAFQQFKSDLTGNHTFEGMNEGHSVPAWVDLDDEDSIIEYLDQLRKNYETSKRYRKHARKMFEDLGGEAVL